MAKSPFRKIRKDKGQPRGRYIDRWKEEQKLKAYKPPVQVAWVGFIDECPCCGTKLTGKQKIRMPLFVLEEMLADVSGDAAIQKPQGVGKILTPTQAEAKARAIARHKPIFDRQMAAKEQK